MTDHLTTEQIKLEADAAMAGFDELPADVRRAMNDCVFAVTDVAQAHAMWRAGQLSPAELLRLIRDNEIACNKHGAANGEIAPQPDRRFVLRARPGIATKRMTRRDPIARRRR